MPGTYTSHIGLGPPTTKGVGRSGDTVLLSLAVVNRSMNYATWGTCRIVQVVTSLAAFDLMGKGGVMRRILSVLPIVLVLAVVATPVVMADTGGDEAAPVDLSSRSAINAYLSSIGVDPATAVFQSGSRNYAGPECPGSGWTCTKSTGAVVQMTSGSTSHNIFVCKPGSGAAGTCVIVQTNTSGTNTATCFEHNEAREAASQSCSITQSNTSGRNFATVVQSIRLRATGNATQDAAQKSQVTQNNGSGPNNSNVLQNVLASISDALAGGAVTQVQEGNQDTVVGQTSTTGTNTSILSQSILENVEAKGNTPINQAQNARDAGPNSDAEVTQTSSLSNGGKNFSFLNQVNILHGNAANAASATQRQGSSTGGLEGTVHQISSRPVESFARQVERQKLDASGIGSLTQIQIDPKRCCSHQENNPNNVWDIDQIAVQEARDDAIQVATAIGTCRTTGFCNIDQTHTQNGVTQTNSCEGQVCDEVFVTCDVKGEGEFCPEPSPSPSPTPTESPTKY
jgi:hypothetical protein